MLMIIISNENRKLAELAAGKRIGYIVKKKKMIRAFMMVKGSVYQENSNPINICSKQ